MIIFEEVKQILNTKIPFNELIKNNGIYEFHEINDISFGISREEDKDNGERYIYNLFVNGKSDEYINIDETGTKDNPITDLVINEIVDQYNKLILQT